jgi:hypothetical protein
MRVLAGTGLLIAVMAACREHITRPIDSAGAYVAVLATPDLFKKTEGELTLNTERLSDNGSFDLTGPLPFSVIERITRTGAVRKVCNPGYRGEVFASCEASALGTTFIRFSRIVPVGGAEFDLFVAEERAPASPAGSISLASVALHRCRVTWRDSLWQRRGCTLVSIS